MPQGDNKLNLTGETFGKLLVLHPAGRTPAKKVVWECQCECGKLFQAIGSELKSGHTKSCGCQKIKRAAEMGHKNRGPQGTMGLIVRYSQYKHKAKRKQLLFELTKVQFKSITQQLCFYCGKPPNSKCKGLYRGEYEVYVYNGLDRIDNSLGYTKENVVSCCKRCNIAKNNQTQDEFFTQIKAIYELHELWK